MTMQLDMLLNACGFSQVEAPGYEYVPPGANPLVCGCGAKLEVGHELAIPADHGRRFSYLHVTIRHPRPVCAHFLNRLGMQAR